MFLLNFRNYLTFSDDLLADPTSFIYGQSPGTGNIPIYAKVTICNSIEFDSDLEGMSDLSSLCIQISFVCLLFYIQRSRYPIEFS